MHVWDGNSVCLNQFPSVVMKIIFILFLLFNEYLLLLIRDFLKVK